MTSAPTLVHVATTDMSLELLLGPQLSAFVDAGYHVIGASAPGPYVSSLEARGVEHVALRHATRSMALASDLGALRELVSLFRARRPAIVHTHNPKPGFYGRIAGRIAGVPVVVNTVHGLYALPEDPWVRRTVVYALERGAATCSLVELVQNVEDLDTLRRLHVPDHKLVHLGNGIDLDRFDPMRFDAADATRARRELGAVAPEDVTVSSVGRLVAEKGHREVIAAAKLLPSNARVSVIGFDEPEKSGALTTDDRAAALASGVRMMGARHDIDWLYTGMDVFVLASHREGVPRAAMEAAAMGVPIVATDVRGCRQVVEHGVTGLLVPVRAPQALAAAVRHLVVDPTLRAEMGRAARARALRLFDQQRCIDVSLATYERALHARGLPAPAAAHGIRR